MSPVDTERGRLRRAAILRAAEQCFARRGYRASSVRDICAEAGISIGGFYLYFSSKEAVVEALARDGTARLQEGLERLRATGDAAAALGSLLEGALAELDGPDALTEARSDVSLWAESIPNPRIGEILGESMARVLGILGGVVTRTGAADADGLARVLVATLSGLQLQRVAQPEADLRPAVERLSLMLRSQLPAHE